MRNSVSIIVYVFQCQSKICYLGNEVGICFPILNAYINSLSFMVKISMYVLITFWHGYINPGSAMTGPVRSWRVALTNQDRTGLVNGRH